MFFVFAYRMPASPTDAYIVTFFDRFICTRRNMYHGKMARKKFRNTVNPKYIHRPDR